MVCPEKNIKMITYSAHTKEKKTFIKRIILHNKKWRRQRRKQ